MWRVLEKVSRNFYVPVVVRKGRESGGNLGGLRVIVQRQVCRDGASETTVNGVMQVCSCVGLCPVNNRIF